MTSPMTGNGTVTGIGPTLVKAPMLGVNTPLSPDSDTVTVMGGDSGCWPTGGVTRIVLPGTVIGPMQIAPRTLQMEGTV